jgi:hypothetical protein
LKTYADKEKGLIAPLNFHPELTPELTESRTGLTYLGTSLERRE